MPLGCRQWPPRRVLQRSYILALALILCFADVLADLIKNDNNGNSNKQSSLIEETHYYEAIAEDQAELQERLVDVEGLDDRDAFDPFQDTSQRFFCNTVRYYYIIMCSLSQFWQCGRALTSASQLFDFPSPLALLAQNESFLANKVSLTQGFENPEGSSCSLCFVDPLELLLCHLCSPYLLTNHYRRDV